MAIEDIIGGGLGFSGAEFLVTRGLSVGATIGVKVLQELIDKQDNFEITRDMIAAILAAESSNQEILATAGGKDPALWKLRVFSERSNPWEQYQKHPVDTSPIVNVWLDNASYDMSRSNAVSKQGSEVTYNIDVYGYGRSADVVGGGHAPGDKQGAEEAHRAARLVRNILMAAHNAYLQMRGVVGQRWLESITSFQPQQGVDALQSVSGARLALRVFLNEVSPQTSGTALEQVFVDVVRPNDGFVKAEADYDFTQ